MHIRQQSPFLGALGSPPWELYGAPGFVAMAVGLFVAGAILLRGEPGHFDTAGVEWQVWDVRPEGTHLALTPNRELQNGWLVFQSPTEKRRLCPIPDDWEICPEERLYLLSRVAASAHTAAT